MAFIESKGNVPFVGVYYNEKVSLFNLNDSDLKQNKNIGILSCDDSFPVQKFRIDDVESNVLNGANTVLAVNISACGSYVAATDSKKILYLWQKTNNTWAPLNCTTLDRKGYRLIFTYESLEVLIADRGGDVFSYSFTKLEKPRLILGHISIVLDLAITKNDEFLITCDRDGKIRVSMYPNCYSIVTYCLGCEEFVSVLRILPLQDKFLVSGSGEGSLRLWNYLNGQVTACHNISHDLKDFNVLTSAKMELSKGSEEQQNDSQEVKKNIAINRIVCCKDTVAVLLHEYPVILVYSVKCPSEIKPLQCIRCNSAPLDIYFDCDKNLWVIMNSEECPVEFYQCNDCDKTFLLAQGNAEQLGVIGQMKNDLKTIMPLKSDTEYLHWYKLFNSETFEANKKFKNVEPLPKKNKVNS